MDTKTYMVPIAGGDATIVANLDSVFSNDKISPDGKYIISSKSVKIKNITGADDYPQLGKSNVYIFDSLNYLHWDKWEDGKFDHVFFSSTANPSDAKDIMPDQPYDCPQKPFGGDEDHVWDPDSKHIVYVTKEKYGTEYTVSM